MAAQQDKVFNEQAFLLDFYNKTVEANDANYKNFIQLEGRSAGVVNKILAKGNPNVLWDLNQAQLALLVPKIAIYKVQKTRAKATKAKPNPRSKTTQKRFVFDDHTSIESMLNEKGKPRPNRGRGYDAGLVSFSWNDQGTDPGNSGLSFGATLKLKFASFDGIFKIRDNGLSFAELLVPPGVLSRDAKKRDRSINSKIATRSGRREIDPSEFQIKAVVGWQVPSDPGRTVFQGEVKKGTNEVISDGTLAAAIRHTQTAFLLTLTGHDIDIKEDGAIELTINYQASMEGYMMTPRMDLLKIDYSDIEAETAAVDIAGGKPKSTVAEAIETLDDWKKKTAVDKAGKMTGRYERIIQAMITANAMNSWKDWDLTASERQWMKTSRLMKLTGAGGLEKATDLGKEKYEAYIREAFADAIKDRDVSELKKVEIAKEKVKYEKNKVESAKKDLRSAAYSRLLCAIDNRAQSRLFYISLNQTQIELYKDMYDDYHTKGRGAVKAKTLLDFRRSMRKKINKASDIRNSSGVGSIKVQKSTVTSEEYLARVELNQKLVAANGDKEKIKEATKWYQDRKKTSWEKLKDGVGDFFGYSGEEPETASPPYVLNFFYFGDLVAAALQILSGKEYKNVYQKNNMRPAVATYKDFRFILGTIDVYNPISDRLESVPLADIPISSMLFQNWFRKNVIEKDIVRLPLLTFLRQIATQLIVGALKSMRTYRPAEGPLNTKLSISSFLLHEGRMNRNGGRLYVDNIGSGVGNKSDASNAGLSFADISKLRQYYFLYIGGTLNKRLKGDEESDRKQGIFHAFVGKNTGIIKRISFKRTDLPFQREARMADAPGDAKSNLLFSDWYNAEITMVGNSVFRPGMLLFIDPTAMGYGMTVANKKAGIAQSRASQLGIGGYYLIIKAENTIESGKYETTLELVAEAPMFSLKDVGVSGHSFRAGKKKKKDKEDKAKRKKEFQAMTRKKRKDAAEKRCDDTGDCKEYNSYVPKQTPKEKKQMKAAMDALNLQKDLTKGGTGIK